MTRAEIVTEVLVFPTGCPVDHIDATTFAVKVTWRGRYVRRSAEQAGEVDWYSVEHMGSSLSRGGNWSWLIQRFQRWQHRFTFDEAIAAAREQVDGLTVNGRTFQQWEDFRANSAPPVATR